MKLNLAEIAYNAYCEHTGWRSLISGHPLPRWAEVKPEIRAAWEVSADAVAAAAVGFILSPMTKPASVAPDTGNESIWQDRVPKPPSP